MTESTLPTDVLNDEPPADATPPLVFDDAAHEPREKEAQQARDLAFQAAPFTWQGIALAPFAIDREGDWLIHRALIGAPSLGTVLINGTTFLADACRILWFCAHDPKEWLTALPEIDPRARALYLEQSIREWSVQNIPPGTQTQAVTFALDIYNRAHTTRVTIKPERRAHEDHAGN